MAEDDEKRKTTTTTSTKAVVCSRSSLIFTSENINFFPPPPEHTFARRARDKTQVLRVLVAKLPRGRQIPRIMARRSWVFVLRVLNNACVFARGLSRSRS